MNYTFYELAMLFFTYSFLAWLAETAVATIKVRNFRNRGFASGPFCFLYGFTGVILTVFLQELKGDVLFLFRGSMAVATAVEWFAGKTLERLKQKKWWDYSGSLSQPAGHCGKGSNLGAYGGGSGRFYGVLLVYLPYRRKTAAAAWVEP